MRNREKKKRARERVGRREGDEEARERELLVDDYGESAFPGTLQNGDQQRRRREGEPAKFAAPQPNNKRHIQAPAPATRKLVVEQQIPGGNAPFFGHSSPARGRNPSANFRVLSTTGRSAADTA